MLYWKNPELTEHKGQINHLNHVMCSFLNREQIRLLSINPLLNKYGVHILFSPVTWQISVCNPLAASVTPPRAIDKLPRFTSGCKWKCFYCFLYLHQAKTIKCYSQLLRSVLYFSSILIRLVWVLHASWKSFRFSSLSSHRPQLISFRSHFFLRFTVSSLVFCFPFTLKSCYKMVQFLASHMTGPWRINRDFHL